MKLDQFNENCNLIFKCIAGSHLYGNATPESDMDIRGVFIPNKKYYLGFINNIEQVKIDSEDDMEYFELKKFLKLAIDNNPNIVEFLFIPDQFILKSSKEWELIKECRHDFLSSKAKFTFSGYAHSQLNRIKRHRGYLLNPPKKKPERIDFNLPERKLISNDQIGAFNTILSIYLEEIRSFHKLKNQLDEMEETFNFKVLCQNIKNLNPDAVKTILPIISYNFLEALEKEKAYLKSLNEWNSYQNWKNERNEKRKLLESKYGYDTKHASHLYRLILECEEILMNETITFPRPEAELLTEIRNGCWTYDELIERVSKYDILFEEIYKNTKLPKKANINKIDQLCIQILEQSIKD